MMRSYKVTFRGQDAERIASIMDKVVRRYYWIYGGQRVESYYDRSERIPVIVMAYEANWNDDDYYQWDGFRAIMNEVYRILTHLRMIVGDEPANEIIIQH